MISCLIQYDAIPSGRHCLICPSRSLCTHYLPFCDETEVPINASCAPYDLNACNAEIDRVQNILQSLVLHKARLQRNRNDAHTIVGQFPTEILTLIFREACLPQDPDAGAAEMLLSLTAIGYFWPLDIPDLWATISIKLPTAPPPRTAAFETALHLYLERSRLAPLSIHLCSSADPLHRIDMSYKNRFILPLCRESHRWRHLHVSFMCKRFFELFLQTVNRTCSDLRQLNALTITDTSGDPSSYSPEGFTSLCGVTKLELRGNIIHIEGSPFAKTRSLSVQATGSRPNAQILASTVASAARLKSLIIFSNIHNIYVGSIPAVTSQLTNLTLHLSDADYTSFGILLAPLILPSLSKLTLIHTGRHPPSAIPLLFTYVAAFCSKHRITDLTLLQVPILAPDLVLLFEEMTIPFTALYIHESPTVRTITPVLLRGIMDTLPVLTRLGLIWSENSEIDESTVMGLIEMRTWAAGGLKCATVGRGEAHHNLGRRTRERLTLLREEGLKVYERVLD
ncbi:hypothetical protein F5146DRAFT_1034966 [Armillaria mellea]|nr:hypothetical protein F5146DRAFT_1034966 [Armillaria mellea]